MKKSILTTRKYVIIGTISILLIIVGTFYFWKSQQKNKPAINTTTNSAPISVATMTLVDPKIKEFGLKIDKLNILVPVIKNVDGNDKIAYEKALTAGVAHFKSSALPNEPGNIFIFGHSSADVESDYSKIFFKLNNIEKDDEIILYYQNEEHKYEVKEKNIVEATNLSVLEKGEKEMLTLMTCWPIGTKTERLIIIAESE